MIHHTWYAYLCMYTISFVCSREKAAMDSELVQDFVTIKGVQKLRKQFPE